MMPNLEVVAGRERWDAILQASFASDADIYFIFDLCDAYAAQYGAVAEAVFYADEHLELFYPYLVRDIRRIPLFAGLADEACDIVTPYGYGGPLIKVTGPQATESMARFRAQFEEYAHGRNFVSEFIRFHPALDAAPFLKPHIEVSEAGSVALIQLDLLPEEIIKRFASDKRRGVKKAEQAGVEVEFVHQPTEGDIAEFLALYEQTMDRNTAEDKYYFSAPHLLALKRRLGDKFFLVRAILGGECISSYLIFEQGVYLTNFLSGSSSAHHQYYPKNKIIWELVKYGHKRGCKIYNLGGGRPSLLNFKAGFATELRPFYVGKKIFNQGMYDKLVYMAALSPEEQKFFPAYRHTKLYPDLL